MTQELPAGESSPALSIVLGRAAPAFYVVDAALRVAFHSDTGGTASALPAAVVPIVADLVRRLHGSRSQSETAIAAGELLVRALPLQGSGPDRRYGILVERFALRNSVATAVRRFGLSAREGEVLEGLLTGESTQAIARRLFLAESTVSEHIRKIGHKTSAKKRGEIVAAAIGLREM